MPKTFQILKNLHKKIYGCQMNEKWLRCVFSKNKLSKIFVFSLCYHLLWIKTPAKNNVYLT